MGDSGGDGSTKEGGEEHSTDGCLYGREAVSYV